MKYEIVKSTDEEEIGKVLNHTQVSPILKVSTSGSLHDFEGREYVMVESVGVTEHETPGFLGIGLIALLVIGIGVFLFKKKS